MKNLYGNDFNDDYYSVRHNRARAWMDLGEKEVALIELSHIFKKRKENLGDRHPNTVATKLNVIKILFKTENFVEALQLVEEEIKFSEVEKVENHHETLSLMEDKAEILQKMGENNEAVLLLNKERIILIRYKLLLQF
jgi:uncharacterized protein with gpF-like domain